MTPPDDLRAWYATPAIGATYHAHLLRSPSTGRGGQLALCGERRAQWWPVDKFVNPHAFTACPTCAQMGDR